MRKYDHSLDAIKGFSCVLMVMAHIPSQFLGYELIYQFIGGLAPVLFLQFQESLLYFKQREKISVLYLSFI